MIVRTDRGCPFHSVAFATALRSSLGMSVTKGSPLMISTAGSLIRDSPTTTHKAIVRTIKYILRTNLQEYETCERSSMTTSLQIQGRDGFSAVAALRPGTVNQTKWCDITSAYRIHPSRRRDTCTYPATNHNHSRQDRHPKYDHR